MLESETRRHFLKTLGQATLIGITASTLGGCEWILQQIRNRPMRRDLATLAASDPDIVTYQAAVAAMKALPSSDPRNWQRQADIHQNFCPHGNWFFLPWHRAYLLYFEQICRELTGNQRFALPYWNWTCNRTIPAVFQGGTSNPLFHPGRVASPPAALADGSVGPGVIDAILDETNFLLFASGQATSQRPGTPGVYGPLEGNPHNTLHGFIGGDMGNFQSPRDPIFWTHHNMIDRIWYDWNVVRGNANTNDPVWANYTFTGNFVDGKGNGINIQSGILVLAPLLSYQYDNSPITSCGAFGLSRAKIDSVALRRFLEQGAPVNIKTLRTFQAVEAVEVPVGGTLSRALRARDPSVAETALSAADTRVLIRVAGVQQPPSGDFFVRVFVDKPDATAATPISDPHYAGSFAFFTDPKGHAHGPNEAAFLVDATKTIERLNQHNRIRSGDEVTLQLVAVRMTDQPLRQKTLPLNRLEIQLVKSEATQPKPFGLAQERK